MLRKQRPLSDPPFDHFGLLAPLYERFIRPPDASWLLSLSDPRPEHCLLDIGGGTGRVSQYFVDHVQKVFLVDVSYGMLQQARIKGELYPCVGVSEHLPFQDGQFQRIIAVDSFHHFRDQVRAAAEVLRILAPGGRLVVEEPNIEHFGVKLVALGEKLALMRSRFYRARALARLLEQFGGGEINLTLHLEPPPNYWIVVDKM